MSGVYVHIPFCHSKCAYCDFYSTAGSDAAARARYVEAVPTEWRLRQTELSGTCIETVYFGGGTPSMLLPEEIARILSAINLTPGSLREVTIEVNPEDVDSGRARAWIDCGINRVSMGVQSLCDDELRAVGRRHTALQAIRAVETLRDAGFDNISLDLIYGLPGQSTESFGRSLHGILDLAPQHLSAYMLSYEPRTRLTAMLKSGRISEVSEDDMLRMYATLIEVAAARGYDHYEISNFAVPGFRAAHNSSYWDGTPYLGLGPGAHSFDGTVRRVNPCDLRLYIEKLSNGQAVFEIEEENDDDRFNDMLITALRTREGLAIDKVPQARRCQLERDAAPWLQTGELTKADGRLYIPEAHWPVSDAVMRDLMQISNY